VGARVGFEAGRAGALAFVERPLPVGDELLPALAASVAQRARGRPTRRGAERLVGASPAMRRVRLAIRRVAPRPVSVLVQGETGTGKELAALALHEESGRGPFVAVSLPELSEGVLESELFGHRRGAFTGAVAERAGLFEAAHGGTLFLDEIGDAPAAVQVKLLRALEARAVRRVGAAAARRVDVRVVAATNRDLGELVRRGAFREDLYFRVRGALLRLPPLRDRAADLPALAETILADATARDGRASPELAPDGLALLARLPWRGNVRELRGLLENALLWWSGAGPIGRAELLEALASLDSRLDDDDCALAGRMLEAWRRCGWNQEAARRELGLSRAAWRSRLARLGLDVARRRRGAADALPRP
jgi:DNA-binding NtrC family response regulator